VRKYAMADPAASLHYLGILDQIRDFRHRHWSLTKEYILKHTTYPRATGGSPIVTWLPNQLKAVLDTITVVGK
jgi:indoleamine 2,3-dioxygenase